MKAKGYEVSRNTQELEVKLQSYIEHRLGARKMTIELGEVSKGKERLDRQLGIMRQYPPGKA